MWSREQRCQWSPVTPGIYGRAEVAPSAERPEQKQPGGGALKPPLPSSQTRIRPQESSRKAGMAPTPGSSLMGVGPTLPFEGQGLCPFCKSLGLRHQETDGLAPAAHLCLQQSFHFASAVACRPGTHFSGEPSQCVPCTPGTYQDKDGQLSCTPCPSSDGLGPAGAHNVSECGGKCGSTLEREATAWGTGEPPRAPKAKARCLVLLCKALCRLQSLP